MVDCVDGATGTGATKVKSEEGIVEMAVRGRLLADVDVVALSENACPDTRTNTTWQYIRKVSEERRQH